jgi:GxxExxY protein
MPSSPRESGQAVSATTTAVAGRLCCVTEDDFQARSEPDRNLDRLARATIGAAIEVHRILGPGFLESVYEEALAVELGTRGIPNQRQAPLAIRYKTHPIAQARLDLVVGGRLLVELKTVDALAPIHVAQLLSYLKAAEQPLGLLINFNVAVLNYYPAKSSRPATILRRAPPHPNPLPPFGGRGRSLVAALRAALRTGIRRVVLTEDPWRAWRLGG